MAEIANENVETLRISTNMRVTTEEFVKRQLELNTEVEKRCRKLTQEIEARFAELRQELGTELVSSKANAGEIREMPPVSKARRRRWPRTSLHISRSSRVRAS